MNAVAHKHIPYDRYRAIDAANWTGLKHLRDSPLAYRYWLDNPDQDTTGRMRGRCLHALVFEPETFERDYAVWDGDARRGKEWEAFKAAHPDVSIIKSSELDEVRAQADAVRQHAAVAPYLSGGRFELSIEWTDEASGLRCKGRMDWWHQETRTLIDLKGTNTIHPHYFGRIAARQGYHCQLAHYGRGIKAVSGKLPAKTMLVAVLTRAPFDVGAFVLSDDDLYAGEEEVAELLKRLSDCRALNVWPGMHPFETPLKLPPYIWGDEEEPAGLGVDFAS